MPAPRERALGWRRDLPGDDEPASRMLAANRGRVALPPLAKPSLYEFRGAPIYQGMIGSCMAFGRVRAFQLWCSANGITNAPLASPRALYWAGRIEEYAGIPPEHRPPLYDMGCYPRLMMRAVEALGYVSWDACPYPESEAGRWNPALMGPVVTQQPAPNVWASAYSQRGMQVARIGEQGGERWEVGAGMMQELRCSVGFGILVDGAFLRNSGQRITTIDSGNIVGGHWLEVLEFLPNGDVLVDNWWEGWGRSDGTGIISGAVFGSSLVSDVYATLHLPMAA